MAGNRDNLLINNAARDTRTRTQDEEVPEDILPLLLLDGKDSGIDVNGHDDNAASPSTSSHFNRRSEVFRRGMPPVQPSRSTRGSAIPTNGTRSGNSTLELNRAFALLDEKDFFSAVPAVVAEETPPSANSQSDDPNDGAPQPQRQPSARSGKSFSGFNASEARAGILRSDQLEQQAQILRFKQLEKRVQQSKIKQKRERQEISKFKSMIAIVSGVFVGVFVLAVLIGIFHAALPAVLGGAVLAVLGLTSPNVVPIGLIALGVGLPMLMGLTGSMGYGIKRFFDWRDAKSNDDNSYVSIAENDSQVEGPQDAADNKIMQRFAVFAVGALIGLGIAATLLLSGGTAAPIFAFGAVALGLATGSISANIVTAGIVAGACWLAGGFVSLVVTKIASAFSHCWKKCRDHNEVDNYNGASSEELDEVAGDNDNSELEISASASGLPWDSQKRRVLTKNETEAGSDDEEEVKLLTRKAITRKPKPKSN